MARNKMKRSHHSSAGVSTTSGGSKVPKNGKGSSPSASATRSKGLERLREKLRSPLRSPLAVPLIRLLNSGIHFSTSDCPLVNRYCIKEQNYNNYFEKGRDCFQKSLKKWNGEYKVPFTSEFLIQELQDIWKKPSESPSISDEVHCSQGSTEITTIDFSAPTKADCQCYLTGNCRDEEQRGKIDIVLYERSSDNYEVANPISLMEIGVKGKHDFWEKIAQGDDYAGMMRDPTKNTTQKGNGIKSYKLYNPMLLSCIIIGRDADSQNFCGDFGIFLCIPAHEEDGKRCCRYVLLWRKRVDPGNDSVKEALEAFGKIIQASCALRDRRKKECNDIYTYKGPNCAKIGKRLYRLYDTRIFGTDRLWALYLSSDKENAINDEEGEVCQQTTSKVGFHWYPKNGDGQNDPPEGESAQIVFSDHALTTSGTDCTDPYEWLWGDKGWLLVISIPYREGRHQAAKVSDFCPIYDHLLYLHNSNKVHGNLRAFNIVFGIEKGTGWLIDLDFGGRAGEATYPKNYVSELEDGDRLGRENKVIKRFDDYWALWNIMHSLHIYEEAKESTAMAALESARITHFFDRADTDDWEQAKDKLSKFITAFGEIKVKPSRKFREILSELGDPAKETKKQDDEENDTHTKAAETNKEVATGSLG